MKTLFISFCIVMLSLPCTWAQSPSIPYNFESNKCLDSKLYAKKKEAITSRQKFLISQIEKLDAYSLELGREIDVMDETNEYAHNLSVASSVLSTVAAGLVLVGTFVDCTALTIGGVKLLPALSLTGPSRMWILRWVPEDKALMAVRLVTGGDVIYDFGKIGFFAATGSEGESGVSELEKQMTSAIKEVDKTPYYAEDFQRYVDSPIVLNPKIIESPYLMKLDDTLFAYHEKVSGELATPMRDELDLKISQTHDVSYKVMRFLMGSGEFFFHTEYKKTLNEYVTSTLYSEILSRRVAQLRTLKSAIDLIDDTCHDR